MTPDLTTMTGPELLTKLIEAAQGAVVGVGERKMAAVHDQAIISQALLSRLSPVQGWQFGERPQDRRRFVSLYDDGSGATLFWSGDGVLIDADGDERDWCAVDALPWAYLPDGMKLWCEIRSDDPLTLPDTLPLAPSDKEAG